ncbi:hypothetical protein [Phenylobacterium sp.]|jgi:hypothetical protein|uniref:hypothetical protein n=1 Tax=Phenylobacterium sp. TaxID=1871053 RepID=UPI002E31AB35|nr:hypothetical protein [Phenylobacterium sp.]HEX2562240.1 hypothetical protein [Phenylobacterium sp.]
MLSLPAERIDLRGASGAVYGFHLADPQALPERAGAYALCRPGEEPLLIAETDRLDTAAAELRRAQSGDPEVRLFIRLNVRRQIRLDELSDILAARDRRCGADRARTAA